MSRLYRFDIQIEGYQAGRQLVIEKAVNEVWRFWEMDDFEETLSATGEGTLYAGCTEQHLAKCLAEAVWKANGGYCHVQVDATRLESLPYTEFQFDEQHYQEMLTTPVGGAVRASSLCR